MEMGSAKTLNKIEEYAKKCDEMITLDEITNFDKTIFEFLEIICGPDPAIDLIKKDVRNYQDISQEYFKSHNSLLEQAECRLKSAKLEAQELSENLTASITKSEELTRDKDMLESAIKSLQTERDIIAAFKMGTMSNFSYNKNVKFGYFLNEDTGSMKTFPADIEKCTEEDIDQRWSLLKSFIDLNESLEQNDSILE